MKMNGEIIKLKSCWARNFLNFVYFLTLFHWAIAALCETFKRYNNIFMKRRDIIEKPNLVKIWSKMPYLHLKYIAPFSRIM